MWRIFYVSSFSACVARVFCCCFHVVRRLPIDYIRLTSATCVIFFCFGCRRRWQRRQRRCRGRVPIFAGRRMTPSKRLASINARARECIRDTQPHTNRLARARMCERRLVYACMSKAIRNSTLHERLKQHSTAASGGHRERLLTIKKRAYARAQCKRSRASERARARRIVASLSARACLRERRALAKWKRGARLHVWIPGDKTRALEQATRTRSL